MRYDIRHRRRAHALTRVGRTTPRRYPSPLPTKSRPHTRGFSSSRCPRVYSCDSQHAHRIALSHRPRSHPTHPNQPKPLYPTHSHRNFADLSRTTTRPPTCPAQRPRLKSRFRRSLQHSAPNHRSHPSNKTPTFQDPRVRRQTLIPAIQCKPHNDARV
jgi:hypothetical protein